MRRVPLLRIFLLFAFGIILSENFPLLLDGYKLYIFPIILSLSTIVLIISKFNTEKLFLLVASLILIIIGYYSHMTFHDTNLKTHFSNYTNNEKSKIKGEIKAISKTKNGTKFIINTKQFFLKNNRSIPVTGNLLAYTNVKYDSLKYKLGDIISFECYISPISSEQNPFAFNPKKFYHYQNIHFQTYIKSNSINLIAKNKNTIREHFDNTNNSIKNKIRAVIRDDTLANIAISIILGDKQNIDKEILNTFSSTGARHILTVSGMHVGIVALILNFLFSFYRSNTIIYRTVKITLILAGVWYYAFLTGNGAAILRASFMISLVMIGINLRKSISIINLLFGSALILIIYNPFLLFQLSFILSYSAMLSIFLFYNPVYNLIDLKKYKLLNYLWQLMSLSIAAQILIFPLSIYYFHNAPILFILTAIIATPLAFTSIAFGFTIVLFYSFAISVSHFFGAILEFILKYSLLIIREIESISFNIGKYFFIEPLELVIIFFSIALFTLYIYKKRIHFLYGGITLILILIINQIWKNNIINKTEEIVFYSTSKYQLTDIFIDGLCYSINNDKIEKSQLNYSAKNYRIYKKPSKLIKIDSSQIVKDINKTQNIVNVRNNVIVFLNSKDDLLPANVKDIDFLVLSSNIKFELNDVLKNYSVKQIILSKSMKYKLKKYWKKQSKIHGIKLWDIGVEGAFIKKLNIQS